MEPRVVIDLLIISYLVYLLVELIHEHFTYRGR